MRRRTKKYFIQQNQRLKWGISFFAAGFRIDDGSVIKLCFDIIDRSKNQSTKLDVLVKYIQEDQGTNIRKGDLRNLIKYESKVFDYEDDGNIKLSENWKNFIQ
jgi:hypothetical protein